MASSAGPKVPPNLSPMISAAALMTVMVSAAVLIGWAIDSRALTSVVPGLSSMKVNTAVGLLLSGSALQLSVTPKYSWARPVCVACALLVLLIGGLTLVEYLIGRPLGIDELFAADRTGGGRFPGRPGVNTAAALWLLAFALPSRPMIQRPAWSIELPTVLAVVIAAVALLGYVYSVAEFSQIASATQMALHTAVSLTVLGLGVLARERDGPMMRIALGPGPGSRIVRHFLPVAVAALIGFGWVRLVAQRQQLFGTELGLALMVLASILTVAVFAFWTAAQVNRDAAGRLGAEGQLRVVVESAPSGMVMIDRAGTIVLVNREVERQFGYAREALLGQPIELLVPSRVRASHPGLRTDFFAHPQTRAMGAGRDLHGLRKDGVEIPVEIGLNPIETDEGMFVLASVVDITQRKRAEAELKRSNEELERFAYVASHDLQEPLRMVGSYVQLLAKRYHGKLDKDADEFIGFALDGALRMQRLIQDLLAFSRVSTKGAALVPTGTAAVVDAALASLRLTIEETDASVTRDHLPTVLADAGQLEHVFLNLISNALKFRGEASPVIHVGASRDDGAWRFTVRDNGIGIEPQYFDRIFVIFQRLNARTDYPGTGIGLAIVKKIVERHGGRIWVESVPGSGTTFSFTLPAVSEA